MTKGFKNSCFRLRFGQAFAAALVTLAMGGAAFADGSTFGQDGPQRRGAPGGERMRGPGAFGPELRGLDLTEDQRAQLRKIREARQGEFKAAGEKLGAARAGMRALMEAETINESAIRAKSQEVAAAEADLAILNAKVRAESLQILTSEQQAKLKELRTNRQGQPRRGPRGQ